MFRLSTGGFGRQFAVSMVLAAAFVDLAWGGLRGDPNNSQEVDTSDAVVISNWLWLSTPMACYNAGDANADGAIDNSDPVYILNWYWQGTPPVPYHIINCTGVQFPNDDTTGPILQQGTPGSVSQHTLIVTHATKLCDTRRHTKNAIDDLLTRFAAASKPIVYLLDYDITMEPQQTQAAANWFTKSRDPSKAFFSVEGNYSNSTLQIDSSTVTVVGGYALECYRRSVLATIKSYFATHSSGTLTINIPMDGVFTSNNRDSYDWPLLLHSYQRAQASEYPHANELDYLELKWYANIGLVDNPSALFGIGDCSPPGSISMSTHRVETYINGVPKTTLSFGSGNRVILFKFYTSSGSITP